MEPIKIIISLTTSLVSYIERNEKLSRIDLDYEMDELVDEIENADVNNKDVFNSFMLFNIKYTILSFVCNKYDIK